MFNFSKSSSKKFIFKNLNLVEAENFPRFYWFKNIKRMDWGEAFTTVSNVIDHDEGRVVKMYDEYFYRKKNALKKLFKTEAHPAIAKFTRTCNELPEFNLTIKVFPVDEELTNEEIIQKLEDKSFKFTKFKVVIENQDKDYLSQFYADLVNQLSPTVIEKRMGAGKVRHD